MGAKHWCPNTMGNARALLARMEARLRAEEKQNSGKNAAGCLIRHQRQDADKKGQGFLGSRSKVVCR
jgi:hypothetical protein